MSDVQMLAWILLCVLFSDWLLVRIDHLKLEALRLISSAGSTQYKQLAPINNCLLFNLIFFNLCLTFSNQLLQILLDSRLIRLGRLCLSLPRIDVIIDKCCFFLFDNQLGTLVWFGFMKAIF